MSTFSRLVREVAKNAGLELSVAQWLAKQAVSRLVKYLTVYSKFRVPGLGTFYWAECKAKNVRNPSTGELTVIPACRRLKFRPVYQLCTKGVPPMEKYGVVLDDEKVKEAERKDRQVFHVKQCPVCGKQLDDAGACPTHGTEPFEKKPKHG